MDLENRMMDTYVIEQSMYIGDKEVVLGVDKTKEYPFMVCYCSYDNPLSTPWPSEALGTTDYLEAMEIFTDRIKEQIAQTKAELAKFDFDLKPYNITHCIPDDKGKSIVGKVVVIDAEPNRHEYQHAAHQLILAENGNGASGGRGQAVFGTRLSDGKRLRWERYDVLGEIRSECMPDWAKTALVKISVQTDLKTPRSKEKER